MQRRALLPSLAAACLASSLVGATPRAQSPVATRDVLFDDGWRFRLGDSSGAERASFDDSSWRALDLPHDWSIEDLPSPDGAKRSGPFDKEASAGQGSTGWVVGGTGWYRKHFRLPGLAADRRVALRFDGSYMETDVWLNGRLLGSHVYGYTGFELDLTPYLERDRDNVLAVRVRNEGRNTRWYSGSGIYRHVWLTTTGPLRVPLWGVALSTPEATEAAATVNATVEIANEGVSAPDARLRVRLVGPDGGPVGSGEATAAVPAGGSAIATVQVKLARPRLWSPSSPSLHRAIVEVVRGTQRGGPCRSDLRDPPDRDRRRARAARQRPALEDEGRMRAPRQRAAGRRRDRPRGGAARRAAEGGRLQRDPHLAQSAVARVSRRGGPPRDAGDRRGVRHRGSGRRTRRTTARPLQGLVGATTSRRWCGATATTRASSSGASATRSTSAPTRPVSTSRGG